jgi:hypothetical protein
MATSKCINSPFGSFCDTRVGSVSPSPGLVSAISPVWNRWAELSRHLPARCPSTDCPGSVPASSPGSILQAQPEGSGAGPSNAVRRSSTESATLDLGSFGINRRDSYAQHGSYRHSHSAADWCAAFVAILARLGRVALRRNRAHPRDHHHSCAAWPSVVLYSRSS